MKSLIYLGVFTVIVAVVIGHVTVNVDNNRNDVSKNQQDSTVVIKKHRLGKCEKGFHKVCKLKKKCTAPDQEVICRKPKHCRKNHCKKVCKKGKFCKKMLKCLVMMKKEKTKTCKKTCKKVQSNETQCKHKRKCKCKRNHHSADKRHRKNKEDKTHNLLVKKETNHKNV